MCVLQRVKTIADRLKPTLDDATVERDKYKKRGRVFYQPSLLINYAL
jgi:hypothetical protein